MSEFFWRLFQDAPAGSLIPKIGIPTLAAMTPAEIAKSLRLRGIRSEDVFLDAKIPTGDWREIVELLRIYAGQFPTAYVNLLPDAFKQLPRIEESHRRYFPGLRLLSLFGMSFRGGTEHADAGIESAIGRTAEYGCTGIILPGDSMPSVFAFAKAKGLQIFLTGVRLAEDVAAESGAESVHRSPITPAQVREIDPYAFVIGEPVLKADDVNAKLRQYLVEGGVLEN